MGRLKEHMIAEMQLQGLSPTTIKYYTGWVKRLAAFHHRRPDTMSQNDIRDFLMSLQKRGAKPATQHAALASLRYFFRMHHRPQLMSIFRRPPIRHKTKFALTEEEIARILAAARNLRDRTFFHLLYASGLRLSEALSLRRSDIDFERRTVFVRVAKNDRSRYTIFGETTAALLREYLVHHDPPGNYLFTCLSDRQKPVPRRWIQCAFARAVQRSGIGRMANVHSLRHAFATHLAERNTNLYIIMQLLGHKRLTTTQIYLGDTSIERLKVASPADQLMTIPGEKPFVESVQLNFIPGFGENDPHSFEKFSPTKQKAPLPPGPGGPEKEIRFCE